MIHVTQEHVQEIIREPRASIVGEQDSEAKEVVVRVTLTPGVQRAHEDGSTVVLTYQSEDGTLNSTKAAVSSIDAEGGTAILTGEWETIAGRA